MDSVYGTLNLRLKVWTFYNNTNNINILLENVYLIVKKSNLLFCFFRKRIIRISHLNNHEGKFYWWNSFWWVILYCHSSGYICNIPFEVFIEHHYNRLSLFETSANHHIVPYFSIKRLYIMDNIHGRLGFTHTPINKTCPTAFVKLILRLQ